MSEQIYLSELHHYPCCPLTYPHLDDVDTIPHISVARVAFAIDSKAALCIHLTLLHIPLHGKHLEQRNKNSQIDSLGGVNVFNQNTNSSYLQLSCPHMKFRNKKPTCKFSLSLSLSLVPYSTIANTIKKKTRFK